MTSGASTQQTTAQRAVRMARGLALACHPIPSLAVTAVTAGLAAEAGTVLSRGVLITAAMFAGQLSIGWCNDAVDADRDRRVHRTDKPVASGLVSSHAVGTASAIAFAVALCAAAPLGWAAVLVLAGSVGCGLAYDLGVKGTPLSWLPYGIAFGALPAVATFASTDPRWPAGWASTAGALFGVAAHFANVLPDLVDDHLTGIRGLPHRLGARATAVVGPLLLVAASCTIAVGPPHHAALVLRGCGLVLAVLVAVWATFAALRDPQSHRYFLAVIVIALLDVLMFALSGTSI